MFGGKLWKHRNRKDYSNSKMLRKKCFKRCSTQWEIKTRSSQYLTETQVGSVCERQRLPART